MVVYHQCEHLMHWKLNDFKDTKVSNCYFAFYKLMLKLFYNFLFHCPTLSFQLLITLDN